MNYILGNEHFYIPNDLISIEDLLKKFKVKIILPKRISELEVGDDFTSYKYYQEFNDLPEIEKEYYYDGYIDDIEEGIIESMDDVFESFHRFESEFQVIEIKEPPLKFSAEDIPEGEDIGEIFLNMDNIEFGMSSCLFYYEYPCPNQKGMPRILEYTWSGYPSPIDY